MTKLLIYGAVAGAIWYFFIRKEGPSPKKKLSPQERWVWKRTPDLRAICHDNLTGKSVDPDVCDTYHGRPGR